MSERKTDEEYQEFLRPHAKDYKADLQARLRNGPPEKPVILVGATGQGDHRAINDQTS